MHSFLKWEDNLSQLSSIVCTFILKPCCQLNKKLLLQSLEYGQEEENGFANSSLNTVYKKRENNAGVTHTSPKLLHITMVQLTQRWTTLFSPNFCVSSCFIVFKVSQNGGWSGAGYSSGVGIQPQYSAPSLSHNESVLTDVLRKRRKLWTRPLLQGAGPTHHKLPFEYGRERLWHLRSFARTGLLLTHSWPLLCQVA